MTITVTTISSGPYTATADSTFAVDFQSVSETEIEVTLDGVVVSPGAYTFTRDDDGTGEVVFDVPVTGEVMISSKPELTQQTEFQRFGAWFPDMINAPLDRIVGQLLYLNDLIGTTQGPQGEQGLQGEPGLDGDVSGATLEVGAGMLDSLGQAAPSEDEDEGGGQRRRDPVGAG